MISSLLLMLLMIFSSECSVHWAVEVNGGIEVAEQIARDNGFEFYGKVGELENMYHFSTSSGNTRSVKRRMHYLKTHNQVGMFMRQKVKFHEKKEYTVPVDPLWKLQWQLYGDKNNKSNNVEKAWLQGLSGKGVTVGVIDDGLEHYHPDLAANYASELSFDFINLDADPRPRYSLLSTSTHGTRCSGIISMAKDNNKCGVGIAHDAKLAGLRLLTPHGTTDIVEATALNHKFNDIDIYSNSWGPSDTGFSVDGPQLLTKLAFENGAKYGRRGKGSIFVWAAGNGGARGDSCAADGYVNSIYTIAVGSADERGSAAYFDEQCSAKLIVTFNHDSTNGVHMSTTTGRKSCMSSFTGTSAASPIVSGVIALALQANPNLTWRDVQYLLIYTANSDVLQSTGLWYTNGAGLNVSSQFGFGAINAEAVVTKARYWNTVPEQLLTKIVPTEIEKVYRVTKESTHTVKWRMQVTDQPKDNAHSTNITFLEHVVVKMTLILTHSNIPSFSYDAYYNSFYDSYDQEDILSHQFARRGDISVSLRSPQGTISELLPNRERDFINTNSYRNWEFMSVHYWGENPSGDWEVLISYRSKTGAVRLSDMSVKFYGTKTTPQSVQEMLSSCTAACDYKCSIRGGVEICDTCKDKRDSKTLKCLTQCPDNYDEISDYCINPDSSLNVETSSSFLASTAKEMEDRVSPTPSYTSLATNVISTTSTVRTFDTVLSTMTMVINTDKPIGNLFDKELKNSASTNHPHYLQWLILTVYFSFISVFIM